MLSGRFDGSQHLQHLGCRYRRDVASASVGKAKPRRQRRLPSVISAKPSRSSLARCSSAIARNVFSVAARASFRDCFLIAERSAPSALGALRLCPPLATLCERQVGIGTDGKQLFSSLNAFFEAPEPRSGRIDQKEEPAAFGEFDRLGDRLGDCESPYRSEAWGVASFGGIFRYPQEYPQNRRLPMECPKRHRTPQGPISLHFCRSREPFGRLSIGKWCPEEDHTILSAAH